MRLYRNWRMMAAAPAIALLLANSAFADRHKVVIDPEGADGLLLQRIQQEPVPAHKQELLEQFAAQFPKSASIAWVYEQLVPMYKEAKDYQKVIAYANALLAVDPNDLDSAHDALRAAQAVNATALIQVFAERAWDLASKTLKSPKPSDPDRAAEWTRQADFANQVLTYSEYVLATQAANEPDPGKREQLIQALVSRNPQSKYLPNTKKEAVAELTKLDPEQALRTAEKGLVKDPDNEDFLMTVANYELDHEKDLPKVLEYSLRILDVMRKKPRPVSLTPQVWEKKKARYTGLANWMAGVVYGKQAHYALSDRHLRAALPNIKDEPRMVAAAYFYLGYDNYILAGQLRELNRAVEAVKFSKLCAAMDSPFRSLAHQNLKSLKTDFNVQ
jgi:tetratricopeptide (TPR) repeat protein